MIKKIVPRLLFLIILFLFFNTQANEINWNFAQEGNKIILIRHALAPGGGDPAGFKINVCSTQRNLNKTGIEQSKKIGILLKNLPRQKIIQREY